MRNVNLLEPLRSQRGIALPTAMIALMLLTTLLIAFAVLSKSEPTIASNQSRSAQARALAEAGVERAMWALTSTVIPAPMASTVAPSPYNGSTFMALGTVGGFFVTVTNGTVTNERVVDAVGWTPSFTTSGLGTAHRKVHLTLKTLKFIVSPPPGALAARGNVSAYGNASIVSTDPSCGGVKPGAYSTGSQSATGGANMCCLPGQMPNVPTSVFDQTILTDADLDALKALAKSNGHYLQGSQTFNAANPLPSNGLIFIDTPSGNNLSCTPNPPTTCTNPPSDTISVTVTTGAAPPGYTTFSGWLIVNGSLVLQPSGSPAVAPPTINGLVYAQNDITMTAGTINGAVMSRNIQDVSYTNFDASVGGTISINYNCSNIKNSLNSTVPTGWSLKAGTYREVSDP